MKSTGKNSQKNNNNDNTIIYLFLFFIIAAVTGISVCYYLNPAQQEITEPVDYKSELGERLVKPKSKEVSKLLEDNEKREKTIRRALASSNKNFSSSQRREIEKELNNTKSPISDFLNNNDFLNELDEATLSIVYSQLYEQGKTLTRLKTKIGGGKSYEKLIKEKFIQDTWEITPAEKAEIQTKLDGWIRAWYNQFMEKELKEGEVRLTEYIKPILIGGQPANANSPTNINHFKTLQEFKKGTNIDLNQPLKIDFQGYDGFLTTEDEKNTSEGKTTFGITISSPATIFSASNILTEEKIDECEIIENNYRSIKIRLKKELFLNREGYDELLINVYQRNKACGRTYYDICFGEVVETIAHELAHAVVNSLHGHYEGEKGGGHGKLFHDFMERIERMMRESSEFPKFETWWHAKKNGKS